MIKWGMIGCGDVAEIKSGPAFSKIQGSSLVAVMRRDEAKVKDYALRHNTRWYTNANDLIHDPAVNAIYIATPPSTHEQYAMAAIHAGQPVYLEKPMATDAESASRISELAAIKNIKVVIAHYRRAQPLFQKLKLLLEEIAIGKVESADLEYYRKPLDADEMLISKNAWRLDPSVSGGGLFHDIAPHQLDIMYWLFGEIVSAAGTSVDGDINKDEKVDGKIIFQNGVTFNGTWDFNSIEERDLCIISGSRGSIRFRIFAHNKIELTADNKDSSILFEPLEHVQQPMIEKVVDYFSGKGENPCPPEDGVKVMQLIESFTRNR